MLALKGLRHALRAAVQAVGFTLAAGDGFVGVAHNQVTTLEKGHGRIETRRITTISEAAWLAHANPTAAWTGLRSIVQATGPVGVHSRRAINGAVTQEDRSATSAPCPATPAWWPPPCGPTGASRTVSIGCSTSPFAKTRVARGRVRLRTEGLAVLRRWALNLLRQKNRQDRRQRETSQSRLGRTVSPACAARLEHAIALPQERSFEFAIQLRGTLERSTELRCG